MEQFILKEDRADVIVPAAEIFLTVAEALGSKSIMCPISRSPIPSQMAFGTKYR